MKTPSPHVETESLRRYARHLVLKEVGVAGQKKLLRSSVLVIGAGGLGSAALGYLAASGIGRLGIVEPDRVELSNLQRQLLFETADIGQPKAAAAQSRLEEINPGITVEPHLLRLDAANAANLVSRYDLVIDGSDNFTTRFAVADACFHGKKTLISAAISAFSAQATTFKPHLGAPHPCYRCLVTTMPERELTCEQEGIIGPLAGMLGSLQALEAIKELLGIGTTLSGSLLIYDALSAHIRTIALPRNPGCPLCSASGA